MQLRIQRFWLLAALAIVLNSRIALAWDIHQTLMPGVLEFANPKLQDVFGKTFPTPCEKDDQMIMSSLIQDLQLNPTSTVPSFISAAPTKTCGPDAPMSIREILLGPPVDDPDQGMDRDLPDSYDKADERNWMGGKKGPPSQGFRHMYWGGWSASHPITTFQIPSHAIGQAIERADLLATRAKKFYTAGMGAWSVRVLGWSLHYIQDLTQPFHAAQIVSFKILPVSELFGWPPTEALSTFKKEAARTVTNYHWALEGYVRTRLKEGASSPFYDCLKNPTQFSQLDIETASSAREIALAVAKASVENAPDLGRAETEFFSLQLKQPGYDLTAFKGEPDYADFAIRPDLREKREALHLIVCRALANASVASERLIRLVLK